MADCHSTLSDDPVIDLRPELPDDDSAADSLVDAFDGDAKLEPLQFACD